MPALTAVPESCFRGNAALTDVNLPKVLATNNYSFYYCSALERIKLPELTIMNEGTPFQNLSALKELRLPKAVKDKMSGATTEEKPQEVTKTQGTAFLNLSTADAVAKIGKLCQADMKTSGILASISTAQFILESGYGKSELAQKANNCFGMKCSLSGNTWAGSTWDGQSKHTIETQEEYTAGEFTTITADFRKYACVEDSIADHSAYLLGAMNGSKLRYDGLKDCTDYKKAAQIIRVRPSGDV